MAGWRLVDVLGETEAEENAEDETRGELRSQHNEFFFLTDPDQFVCTHLPDDPDWQLLPQPLNSRQFEEFVYLREQFFEMGLLIRENSHRYCELETTHGKVTISFGIPKTPRDKPEFKYMLYKLVVGDAKGDESGNGDDGGDAKGDESGNGDDRGDGNDKTDGDDGSVSDNDNELMGQWKGCVFNRQTEDEISYVCRMPTKGRYVIDIFGRANDNADHMDLVCSYVIVCESTGGRLPDAPDIPWGPGDQLEEVGLTPKSHTDSIIDTNTSVVTIRLSKSPGADMVFWHAIKHEEFDEIELRPRATLRISDDGGDVIIKLRLLEPGIYAYKLFAVTRTDATTATDIPNVCNYLIQFSEESSQPEPPFPQLRWGILGYGIHAHAFQFEVNGPGADGYIETTETVLELNLSRKQCDLFYEFSQVPVDLSRSTRTVTLKVHGRDVNDSTTIDVPLPGGGEYALNIYARLHKDKCRLYHVHSMHIVFSAPLVVDEDTVDATSPGDGRSTAGQLEPLGSANDGNQPTTNQLLLPEQNADTVSIAESFRVGDDGDNDEKLIDEVAELETPVHPPCIEETSEEMYEVDLSQSEGALLYAAERKAAQHPRSYIGMTRTDEDIGGGLRVRLPQDGEYIVEVFELIDVEKNLLGNAQRTHVRRSIDVVS
ncbi:hypothetical protein NP493_539g02014 [Ridgeia piscesae]|uniref:KY-like immunoglobulin-like domain-containing protein n=1 Tax=Ridgeia piscesae TaxID=27915 RepID=A0AAD9NQ15_RIDPI|nr:hypothetical protein NP493_539g02014 [Ridgeia piscesae]